MLQEAFQYVHQLESGLGREKAEVFVSAAMEAKFMPESFRNNKTHWLNSFQKAGFEADDSQKMIEVFENFLIQ